MSNLPMVFEWPRECPCPPAPSEEEAHGSLQVFSVLQLALQGEGVLAPGQRLALPALNPVELLEAEEAGQLSLGDLADEGGCHDVGVHQVMEQLVAHSLGNGCEPVRVEEAFGVKAVVGFLEL